MSHCTCSLRSHPPRLVVLTGGPGAGKTAVLELVRQNFCEHVVVLPEAAGIVFGGGFPRRATLAGRRAAQRAIFYVQRELEQLAIEEGQAGVILCDRGTVDGAAYWPEDPTDLWESVGHPHADELRRYAAVIHLRTPPVEHYNHQNPLRVETALEAAAIDRQIALAWSGHPRRFFVECAPSFLDKAKRAIDLVRDEAPACCGGRLVAK
jgi:predicted ATPase